MAQKKKRKTAPKHEEVAEAGASWFEHDAIRAVVGILLFALAVFFVLSAFHVGGVVGATSYHYLSLLLGVGYILFPLTLFLASYVFFRSVTGTSIDVMKIVSTVVFLIAALGLVAIATPGDGGILGQLIAKPLLYAFDTAASVVFLLAFLVASLVLTFETHPGAIIRAIREKIAERREAWEEFEEDELDVPLELPEEDEEDLEDEEAELEDDEEEEDDEVEAPKKKGGLGKLWSGKSQEEEMPLISSDLGVVYAPPPLSLLAKNKGRPEVGDIKANANIIKRTLQNFGIEVEMDEVSIGPTVTRYAMKPAEGVRLAKIVALQSNLELALAASPVRIEAPIPGKSLVGIEVPNTSRTTLGLGPMLSDKEYTQSDKSLLMALGRGISGGASYADLAKMPHMLIAGATGAGKSVTIHNLIVSLLYRAGPERLRFVMVDPKRVELTAYNSIPHLLTPVITDPKKAILALKWLTKEMERRYDVLEAEHVRDISSYHDKVLGPALADYDEGAEGALPESMPYIVVIIDELADLMQMFPRELEAGIVRLAQMSRAVGIHLILSTQRPSVKVITGLIKANVPSRVALQVASQVDSRTILDMGGAEKLLGAGDMLFLSGEMSKPRRIQAPYISEDEVKDVVKWIAKHYENHLPDEIDFSKEEKSNDGIFAGSLGGDSDDDDDLYEDAKAAVMEAGKASTSYLQRKLRIGYSRAARLMDILEERGVIGPQDGSKPREVIMKDDLEEEADELLDSDDVEDADYEDEDDSEEDED